MTVDAHDFVTVRSVAQYRVFTPGRFGGGRTRAVLGFAGNQFAFLGGTFAQNFLQAAVVPAHNFISRCEAHAAVTARISRTNPIDSNQTAKESPRGQS